MSKSDEKDVAKETGVSVREVRQAWHLAREDARKDKEHRDDPNDLAYTGDWKKPR